MTKNELEEFFKAKLLRGKFHRLDDKVDEWFQRMDQNFDAEFYRIND